MVNKVQTYKPTPCSGSCLFLLHVSCFLLVVFYVNMFQFWAWISRQLGPGLLTKTLPVVVTLLVLLVISFRFIQRVNRGYTINIVFLGLGIVGAFLALAIPDPNVPIKRIHVAEYILLSFLVRYTLSHRLEGRTLTVFTALVTIFLGVHDEMLQGFHSLRYYGWRDIIVNGMAGVSGAFLGHALFCFDRAGQGKAAVSAREPVRAGLIVFFILLFGAVTLLIIALYQPGGAIVSLYPLLPLATICLLIFFLHPEMVIDSRKHHGLQAVFWLALGLLIYPVLVLFTGIEFV